MTEKNSGTRHPKGLYLLFATEMWERFSYYGMRALLMLFMTKALLFNKDFAGQIYGSFTGLIYITPLLGGYIADRYWGNRRSIFWGGLVIAIGQFFMFFSSMFYRQPEMAHYLMYLGLCVLILGNGLFKPNIATLVGQLYEPHDRRKDSAYTIFYMGINIGASLSPLWCGFVGDTQNPADFKWGFLSAGIGMLLGVTVFELLKNKYLITPTGEQIGVQPQHQKAIKEENTGTNNQNLKTKIAIAISGFIALFLLFSINYGYLTGGAKSLFERADWIGSAIYSIAITMPLFIITDSSLNKTERLRILVIFIISFFVISFWAAFEQAGASLTFFADEQTDRNIFGWQMPASFFQSFNAVFVVTLAPVFAFLWSWMGRKGCEPSSPVKQAMGLFFLAIGYLIIAFGVKDVNPTSKVSIMWLTSLYLLHTMGELSLSPIGLSIVNKLAPARFASLLMAVWFLSNAVANKFAGTLSGLYPEPGKTKAILGYQISTLFDFFLIFVVISGIASVILFCLSKWLQKLMGGVK